MVVQPNAPPEKALDMVVELYNKQGQQRRCRGCSVEGLQQFDYAVALAAYSAKSSHKIRGWTYAQMGFLLSDLCKPKQSERLLRLAIGEFDAQMTSQQEQDVAKLIALDKGVTQLHCAAQAFIRNDHPQEAESLLKEAELVLHGSTPRRMAQLMKIKGDYARSQKDFEAACTWHREAIQLTAHEAGAEVCHWALLRTYKDWFADDPSRWADAPTALWLDCGKAYARVLDRASVKRLDTSESKCAEVAYPLYLLACACYGVSHFREAQQLVTRALALIDTVWTQLRAMKLRAPVLHDLLDSKPEWVNEAKELQKKLRSAPPCEPKLGGGEWQDFRGLLGLDEYREFLLDCHNQTFVQVKGEEEWAAFVEMCGEVDEFFQADSFKSTTFEK